jgi:ABC-2 type transport system permease protein
MAVVGVLFWGLMFGLCSRVLLYFQSVEVIGDLLAHHLLAMVLLTFFSLLIFSNIIAALSNLYLSRDLSLAHASPAPLEAVFVSRFIYTLIDSSWMVVVFGLPVLMAYAFVYRPSIGFYFALLHVGCAMVIIAAGVGTLLTMILVSIFPAHRTRDILMVLLVLGIAALYLLFRLLRPERLVNPDAFFSVMQYLSALKAPDSPYLPSHWLSEILWHYLDGSPGRGCLFETLLMWSSALAMLTINVWVAKAVYFKGFSKSQEAKRRMRAGRKILNTLLGYVTRPLGPELAAIVDKDVRSFFRDNTQWSQILLLGALVVVYLYNFSVLPLEKSPIRLDFLQNEIAFLNMGLAGFVISAICVRFTFPAVSAEGEAFWIIQSSPLSMKRFLWGKYALYVIPAVVLGEALTVLTNHLLHVTPFMMILSSVTMFLAVTGIVALAIGFGALYPNFKYENISQVSVGYGGVMYMIVSAIFMAVILSLEAGPVYIIFMADLRGDTITGYQWLLIIPSFLAVLLVIGLAIQKPMQMGLNALTNPEK